MYLTIEYPTLKICKRKEFFYKRRTDELIKPIFQLLNLTALLFPRYSQLLPKHGYLKKNRWCFFCIAATFCMRVNLINLQKQQTKL